MRPALHRLLLPAFVPLAFSTTTLAVEAEKSPKTPALSPAHAELLREHCQDCHNADKQKGKFRIDDLLTDIGDSRTAERWKKVLAAMNSGEMPPEKEKQLVAEAKADLLDELAKALVAAQRNLSDSRGVVTMRRLNRREYSRTLESLLGSGIEVQELPPDTDPL